MIAFWWISSLHVLRYSSCSSPLCPKRVVRTFIYLGQSLSLCTVDALEIVVKLHISWRQKSPCHWKPYIRVFSYYQFLFVCEGLPLRSHIQSVHREGKTLPGYLSQVMNPISYFSAVPFKARRVCLSVLLNMPLYTYVWMYRLGGVIWMRLGI